PPIARIRSLIWRLTSICAAWPAVSLRGAARKSQLANATSSVGSLKSGCANLRVLSGAKPRNHVPDTSDGVARIFAMKSPADDAGMNMAIDALRIGGALAAAARRAAVR